MNTVCAIAVSMAFDFVQLASATTEGGVGEVKSGGTSHGTALKAVYEIGRYFKQPVQFKNLNGCEKIPPNRADFLCIGLPCTGGIRIFLEHFRRVSNRHDIIRDILCDNASAADNNIRADCHSRQNNAISA